MRRFLIALFMTCVVASLQAITINWVANDSRYGITDDSMVYFVYAESGGLKAEDLAKGTYTAYSGYNIGLKHDGTTNVVQIGNGVSSAVIDSADVSVFGGKYASVAIDASTVVENNLVAGAPSGYFYLVVFNPSNDPSQKGTYQVSKAITYTAGSSNASVGIYDTMVDGDKPEIGDFVEVEWMGWASGYAPIVPEPTALALLALGVAGLALRRKI